MRLEALRGFVALVQSAGGAWVYFRVHEPRFRPPAKARDFLLAPVPLGYNRGMKGPTEFAYYIYMGLGKDDPVFRPGRYRVIRNFC